MNDTTARTVRFELVFAADYNWYGNFYNEQQAALSLYNFKISAPASTEVIYRLNTGLIRPDSGAGTAIATNSYYTLSTVAFSSNVSYRMTFSYGTTGDTVGQNVFYYQIGCKFLRAHAGM